MKKIVHIAKLSLYVSLWLGMTAIPSKAIKGDLQKKGSTILKNWSPFELYDFDDLMIDEDESGSGFDHGYVGGFGSSFSYDFRFLKIVSKCKLSHYDFAFFKPVRLFILFRCWKLLFLQGRF